MPDMQGIVQNIVISRDKSIYVPEIIKKSIVQRDHNVDRLTFDCPRYWNGIDISKLNIYVNYIAAGHKKQGKEPESFLCENVIVDEDNTDIFHFDWRITSNVSEFQDKLIFIVCAKSVDAEGNEELHWNSRLCTELEVQEGLEASAAIVEKYPDVIEQILSKMGKQIELRNSGIAIQYRNAGENTWTDLVQLKDIKGDAAVIIESNFKGSDTTENIIAKTGEAGDKWYSTDEGAYYMLSTSGEWINCGTGENLKKIEDEIDALKGDISQLSEKIADKATVENGVVRVWKSATEEGGTDTLLYTIDLSSLNTGSGTGVSSTAISLLISILRNAIYESDQSAIITALEIALKEGGSSDGNTGGNEPDVPVDPDKTYYSVFVTKTNCTVNSSATSIEEGGVYVAQITPDEGYTIETVTVTMGGKDVTSTAYSNGSISISNVTGEIVVVATAIETPNDLVYSANWNYGKRQYSLTASQDNASFTSSDWIDVTAGQVLTATLLSSNVIDGVTYNWNNANMKFDVLFRDSSVSAVSPTVAPSGYMNLNNETYPSSQEVTVPDGAVSMCFCLGSGRSYFNGAEAVIVGCESLEGRPVWWSLVLKNGGEA